MKMFRVLIPVLSLIILLLISSCSLFTDSGFTTGTIVGRIILPEGIGQSFSQIYLYLEENPTYMQTVIPGEQFTIEDLKEGKSYSLIATTRPMGVINSRAPEDKSFAARLENIVAETGEGKKLGSVLLRQTGIIQGQIQLYEQSEHVGIDVYIPGTSFGAKTDEEGNFTIYYVPQGMYRLRVEKTLWESLWVEDILVEGDVSGESQPVTVIEDPLVLYKGYGTVTGTVTLAGLEAGFAGITVLLESNHDDEAVYTTSTNSSGEYTQSYLAEGTYTITLSKAGYETEVVNGIDVVNAETTEVEGVSLIANGGSISGTATLSGESTHEGIQILAEHSDSTTTYSTVTNTAGSFSLNNCAAGEYKVTASKSGYKSSSVFDVLIEKGKNTESTFPALIKEAGKVSGRVFIEDENSDHSGVVLTIELITNSENRFQAVSLADGSFKIQNVDDGNYTLTAQLKGYITVTDIEIKVESGKTTQIVDILIRIPDIFNLTYHLDGGENGDNPSTYTEQGDAVDLEDPSRVGYTFSGWYSDTEYETEVTGIAVTDTGDKDLYAKWTVINYTVTYHLDEGTNDESNPLTYTVNDAEIVFEDATKPDLFFAGWYIDSGFTNEVTTITSGSTGDVELFAKFVSTYTIKYNANGAINGDAPVNQEKIPGEDLVLSTNIGILGKTGYTFSGWNTSADGSGTHYGTGSSYIIESADTLYAEWTANTYTITMNGDGGTVGESNVSATYDAAMPTTTKPERTGYTFGGYFTEQNGAGIQYYNADMTSAVNWNQPADATLYAKWTAIEYTITYHLDGGDNVTENPAIYTIEDLEITLAEARKIGLYFVGWFKESTYTTEVMTIPIGSTGDIELYAKFINTYTITYNANGATSGTSPADQEKIPGKDMSLASNSGNLVKTDFIFKGWNITADRSGIHYDEGEAYTVDTDVTLYAEWISISKILASDGAPEDGFGMSIAISGDFAIIGSDYNYGTGSTLGSAYIYKKNVSGIWGSEQKITAFDGAAYDRYGKVVGISGDYAIVGSPADDDNGTSSGSVYIYKKDASGNWGSVQKITASDGAESTAFGISVAISENYAIVGAYWDDGNDIYHSGSMYIYKKDASGTWGSEQKITASDGAASDIFGVSVAISGDYVLVGASSDDENGDDSGSVYFYRIGKDAAVTMGSEQKISASDGDAYDSFGYSVAISGNYAIVPSMSDRDNGVSSGSVYFYKNDESGNWGSEKKISASDGAAQDAFGISVAISGDYAIVGAYRDEDNGYRSGSAYIYKRDASGYWESEQKITASDGDAGDEFGWSVAISGENVIVVAYRDDDNGTDSGSAYPFKLNESNRYTVTFHANGGIGAMATMNINTNSSASLLANSFIKEGYTFTGWAMTSDGEKVCNDRDFFAIEYDHANLYATWIANDDTAYTVQHYQQDVSGDGYTLAETENLTGTTDTTATASTKSYAGFSENTEHENRVVSGNVSGDGSLVLGRYYNRNTYTVSFEENGGSNIDDITDVRYGSTINEPINPTKIGNTFSGWFKESSTANSWIFASDTIIETKKLYAKWTINTYTLSFHPNGGIGDMASVDLAYNTISELTANVFNKTGYNFQGWSITETGSVVYPDEASITMGTSDIILYAVWEPESYEINYHLDGGVNADDNPPTYTIETGVITFLDPTKVGYTFAGWFTDSDYTTEITGVGAAETGDRDVYAKWDANIDTAYKVEHYQQDVSGSGYTKQDTEDLSGTTAATATAVAKSYTGFSENSTHSSRVASGTIAGDGTLVLKLYYDRDTYTVSYHSNGGSSVTSTTGVRYGAKIYKPTSPTKSGSIFSGWYKETALTNSWSFGTDMVTEDIALYANWSYMPEDFVMVEGGSFQMGSNSGDSDERPVHEVTVSDFAIGKYEVTQEQWKAVMGSNPSNWKGTELPVESVSWYDAVEFCNELSKLEGREPAYIINGTNVTCDFSKNGFRLPTEAEWEYAARGGKESKGYTYAGSDTVEDVAWYLSDSSSWYDSDRSSRTHPVGQKQANELGLYDMSGNVLEWCWDWIGNYSSSRQSDPTGPLSGSRRVLRGGSWIYNASYSRVANRKDYEPVTSFRSNGFRLVFPAVF